MARILVAAPYVWLREISRIPYGYERQIYAPDGQLKARQKLHTERNFKPCTRGVPEKWGRTLFKNN